MSDRIGFGIKWLRLWTSLSEEAQKLRDQVGLIPDARPQKNGFFISGTYAMGYGKMMSMSQILHFDPLIHIDGGVFTADERIIPSLIVSFSPTFILRNGFRLSIDLSMTVQGENRRRGIVVTTGFLPMVTIIWGGTMDGIKKQLGVQP